MSKMYDDYLIAHRTGVREAFEWLDENLPQVTAGCEEASWHIMYEHDQSKISDEEYSAYDEYFYGRNKSHKVVEDFNRAWLHHIHNNPHHWQHWVLFEDDPETNEKFKALPMPYDNIVEMICDWWSFSINSGNLREIFDWYEKHEKIMVLHPDTRKQVDRILGLIKEKLDGIEDVVIVVEEEDPLESDL